MASARSGRSVSARGPVLQCRARHALAIVEAAYSLDGSDAAWLGRILEAARGDLDQGCGSYAFTCRLNGASLEMGPAYVERDLDPRFSALVEELNRAVPGAFFEIMARKAVVCGGLAQVAGEASPLAVRLAHLGARAGVVDAFSLFAQDGEGYGIDLSGPSELRVHAHPRVRGIWSRVGVHLASAMRLRRHFHAAHAARDALLAPDGAIAHAEGEVRRDRSARAALTGAVRAVERARTTRERRDPAHALTLWRGLVAGEWSLVDHWESDGRRYVAAYRNRPDVADPRELTGHERTVFRYAALGGSNKEIAFTLGLSVSAVASAVSQLLRKLQCRRRSDLVAFANPSEASRVRLAVGEEAVDVLSIGHAVHGPEAARLSAAEREIASRVVAGETNVSIARARGTSQHTVANQIRGIFDKLDVGSRHELVKTLTQGGASRA